MDVMITVLVIAGALALGAVLFAEDVQVPAGAIPVAVVRGWMDLTVGAGTTAVTITIYRGNAIGGTVIGQKNAEAGDFTAGNTAHFDVELIDLLSNVGGAQYCMSVTQTGAAGNGSVLNALIDTSLLSG